MNDLKYLLAYLTPVSAWLGLTCLGWWTYSTPILAFILIPVLDAGLQGSRANLTNEQENEKANSPFFDYLLYVNIPIYIGLLYYFFLVSSTVYLQTHEWIGLCFSMGILVGTIGINVAHELGHRSILIERFFSQLLLMTAFYMHFHIEHNLGHHRYVATPHDPATARKGQSVFAFWFTSISKSYISAWKIENKLKKDKPFFQNRMIQYSGVQLLWLLLIAWLFGVQAMGLALIIALIGVLLLESINYIEHYGLKRTLLPSGRYERVSAQHSWNSNHPLGRIFLYELTRHSDHHYKASRKYQILRHLDESPQLPYGYPASIVLALIPPVWFKLMDNKLLRYSPGQ